MKINTEVKLHLFLAAVAPVVASAVAWGVIFFCIPYRDQDFPLNDDWAFALSAFKFARGGGVDYFEWAAMPQLGMWVWAYPAISFLGTSNAALRLSTIVLSWIGISAFRDLLRQAGLGPWLASFGACVLLFNPVFFMLTATFMTDVPALSFSLLALACYQRGFEDRGRWWFQAAGCLAAILAGVTRQNALAVPVVAAILLWQRPALRWKALSWTAVLIPAVCCLATAAWFARQDGVIVYSPITPERRRILFLTVPLLITMGLAGLPAALLIFPRRRWPLLELGIAAFSAVLWVGYCRLGSVRILGAVFPYVGNVLTTFGPFGEYILGERPVLIASPLRIVLTGLGVLGATLLLARLRAARVAEWVRQPLLLYAFFQVPFLLISESYFDRYLLVFLPATLLILIRGAEPTRRDWVPGVIGLVVFAGLALALTHDWLSWNAARWSLGRRVIAAGVPLSDLEGGFEWDNWFDPHPDHSVSSSAARGLTVRFNSFRHPNLTGRYGLSFSPLPGALVVDRQPYSAWLIKQPQAFYLLKPDDAAGP